MTMTRDLVVLSRCCRRSAAMGLVMLGLFATGCGTGETAASPKAAPAAPVTQDTHKKSRGLPVSSRRELQRKRAERAKAGQQ